MADLGEFTRSHPAEGSCCAASKALMALSNRSFKERQECLTVVRWCSSSQGHTGIHVPLVDSAPGVLPNEEVLLPALLKQVGYKTAMVGKWHLGFEENGYDQPLPGGPVDRGFHSFFGIRASSAGVGRFFYLTAG